MDIKSVPEISVPAEGEAAEFSPPSFKYKLARANALIGDSDVLTDEYLLLQAVYKTVFNKYLNSAVDFQKFEDKLALSGFRFIPIEPEKLDVYQKYGSFGRKFIYMRNNFHIEALSGDDINLLRGIVDGKSTVGDDDLLQMAGRTFRDVVAIHYEGNTSSFNAVYDAGVFDVFSAPNDALVFAIRHEWEFDEKGNVVSMETEKQKEQFVFQLKQEIEIELSQSLGVDVVVFAYGL